MSYFGKNVNKNSFKLNFQFYNNKDVEKTNNNLIRKRIDNVFNNNKFNLSLEEIIYYVRTLLKDLDDEYLLKIKLVTDNEDTYIEFLNKQLHYFEKTIQNDKDKKLFIKYKSNGEIKIDYPKGFLKLNFEEQNKLYELISKELKRLTNLTNIKSLELSRNDKVLIQVYKLFYGENPDFSSKNIEEKIQYMAYILSEYGLNLPSTNINDICFTIYNKYPTSLYIKNWIRNLVPFADNIEYDNKIVLNKNHETIIRMIGNEIKNYLNQFEDDIKIQTFADFCKTFYTKRHWSSEYSTVEKNPKNECIICSEETTENHLKLMKKIDKKYETQIRN